MDMSVIVDVALSYPLIFFTLLLPVIAFYWLLVAIHIAPLQLFEHDSLRNDNLASTMVSLGFAGIPVSVALTVLFVFAGVFTLLAELLVLRWFDLKVVIIPLGLVVLWAALAVSAPLAARACRRLLRKFRDNPAVNQRCLLGERVQVVGYVDAAGCGRAVLCSDGSREVCLHGKPGCMPKEGEVRVLVKYLADEDRYRSVAEQDFLDARTRLVRLHLVERHEPEQHHPRGQGTEHSHHHDHSHHNHAHH